jgi:hypothetical protein
VIGGMFEGRIADVEDAKVWGRTDSKDNKVDRLVRAPLGICCRKGSTSTGEMSVYVSRMFRPSGVFGTPKGIVMGCLRMTVLGFLSTDKPGRVEMRSRVC